MPHRGVSMVYQKETMLNCSASMVFQNKTIKGSSVTRDGAFKATIYISSEKIVGSFETKYANVTPCCLLTYTPSQC